jgi:hypothetical protein
MRTVSRDENASGSTPAVVEVESPTQVIVNATDRSSVRLCSARMDERRQIGNPFGGLAEVPENSEAAHDELV